jgi:hypothetical protein
MSAVAKSDQQITSLKKAKAQCQLIRDQLHDTAQSAVNENPSLQAAVDIYDAAYTTRFRNKKKQQLALQAIQHSLEAAHLPPELIAYDLQLIGQELRQMKGGRI